MKICFFTGSIPNAILRQHTVKLHSAEQAWRGYRNCLKKALGSDNRRSRGIVNASGSSLQHEQGVGSGVRDLTIPPFR